MCCICLTSYSMLPKSTQFTIKLFPMSLPLSPLGTEVLVCRWELVKGERKDCPVETRGAPTQAELWAGDKQEVPALAREGGWDKGWELLLLLSATVTPQRKERTLAYEKYIKQYNYLVIVNTFLHYTISIKGSGNGAGRSLLKFNSDFPAKKKQTE